MKRRRLRFGPYQRSKKNLKLVMRSLYEGLYQNTPI